MNKFTILSYLSATIYVFVISGNVGEAKETGWQGPILPESSLIASNLPQTTLPEASVIEDKEVAQEVHEAKEAKENEVEHEEPSQAVIPEEPKKQEAKVIQDLGGLLTTFSNEHLKSQSQLTLEEHLNLDQCIKRAVEVHEPAKIAKKELQLAKLRYQEVRRQLFPEAIIEAETVEGSTIGEDFRGEGVSLKVKYPLWDSGKKWKLFKQAKLNLKIAEIQYKQTILDLETEVKKAYYVLANAMANLEERNLLTQETQKVMTSAEQRFDKKLIREIDFTQIKNQFHEVQSQYVANESELVLAELALRQLLGFYNEEPLRIQTIPEVECLQLSLQRCLEQAIQNRPDCLMSQVKVDVARYGKEIAKGENGFQVNLDSSFGYRGEAFKSEKLDHQDEFFVGISASLPLWDQKLESKTIIQDTVPAAGQTTSTDFKSQTLSWNLFSGSGKSQRLEASIQYDRALHEFEKTKQSAFFEVGESYFNYRKAQDQLTQSKERKKIAEQEAQHIEIQVGLYEADLSQLIRSLISKASAAVEYHNSIYGYFSSVNQLDRAVGGKAEPLQYKPIDIVDVTHSDRDNPVN